MITTTPLATTLESVPANAAAASSVGADNIDIDAEIATAARRSAKGTYAHHLGVDSELRIDPSKLIPKVCAIIKSKRGLNENKLPEDLHKQICDKVFSFVTGIFKDKIQPHANLTYKKTPIFRKNHEVSPVALRHTYSSIQEIGFKEQRLLLNTRVGEARRKLEQALQSNIADRITKWTKALDAAEQMLATLDNSEAIANGKQ